MPPSISRRSVLSGLAASTATLLVPRLARAAREGHRARVAAGWVLAGEPGALERELGAVMDAAAEHARGAGGIPVAYRLRVVVTDATSVQGAFGPDRGHGARPALGLVLASTDLLAHDVIVHRWHAWTRAVASHAGASHRGLARAPSVTDLFCLGDTLATARDPRPIAVEWVNGTTGPPGAREYLESGRRPR
jgi:hypothetical protein